MRATVFTWHGLTQAAALTFLLGAGGCDPGGSPPDGALGSVTRGQLDGHAFLLERSEGFDPVAGTTVRLNFHGDELSVSAGCNHLGGRFEIRDASLVLDGLNTTEIGCDAPLHAQDEWLGAFFSSRPRIVRAGDRLTLTGAMATLTFLDREVADPDQPLAGAPWTVDTLLDGASASNYPSPRDPLLTFADDGTLRVESTCNTSDGNYVVSGDRITFSNIAFTDAACSNPAASAVEQHLQKVIANGTVTFSIDARRLEIKRGDVGLSALRAAADAADNAPTATELDGLHFLLETSDGFVPVAGTTIHLIFESDQLSFSADCNGHSGRFQIGGGRVIVDGFRSSLRGCGQDRQAQDEWLASFFASRPRIARNGDRLAFAGADATLIFLDREVADPDQSLAGAPWVIDTILTRDSASTGSNMGTPTLTFHADGTLSVQSTCNQSSGNYVVSGERIALSNIAFTERGCADAAASSFEQHLQKVIADGELTFTIEARRIDLWRGAVGLSATRAAPN